VSAKNANLQGIDGRSQTGRGLPYRFSLEGRDYWHQRNRVEAFRIPLYYRTQAFLIISHFHKKWLLSKGWKHTKIKAKLSVSFGNLGKTFAMFSGIPDRSRAPKAARLHLESGKT